MLHIFFIFFSPSSIECTKRILLQTHMNIAVINNSNSILLSDNCSKSRIIAILYFFAYMLCMPIYFCFRRKKCKNHSHNLFYHYDFHFIEIDFHKLISSCMGVCSSINAHKSSLKSLCVGSHEKLHNPYLCIFAYNRLFLLFRSVLYTFSNTFLPCSSLSVAK